MGPITPFLTPRNSEPMALACARTASAKFMGFHGNFHGNFHGISWDIRWDSYESFMGNGKFVSVFFGYDGIFLGIILLMNKWNVFVDLTPYKDADEW